jgi:eukaryotic-like serine/threonine-protein kinase
MFEDYNKLVLSISVIIIIFLLFNGIIFIPTAVIQPALSQPHTMEMSPPANITMTKFSVYDNPSLGIKILYPSDWKPFQTSTVNRTIIEFRQKVMSEHDPLTSFMSVSVENLSDTSKTLDIMTKQNIDLANKTLPNFKLIESNITTLANNNPAYRIVSTFTNSGPAADPLRSPQFQTMTIWTVKGDMMYTISYSQITSEFLRHLPIIQKMIDSFEITK